MIDAPSPRRRRSSTILLLLPAVVLALLALPHPEHAAATAPLFSDDFESGTMHAWNKDVGLVPEQQTVHAGAWAASMASGGAQGARGDGRPAGRASGAVPESLDRPEELLLLDDPAADAHRGRRRHRLGGRPHERAALHASGVRGSHGLGHAAAQGCLARVAAARRRRQRDGTDRRVAGRRTRDGSLSAPALGTLPIDRVQIGGAAPGRSYSAVFDDVAASPTYVDDLPPVVPSGVHATPVSGTSVELSWNPSTDVGAAGYTLYRQDGSTWKSLGFLTARRFVDTGLQPDTMYRYAIDAVDTTGAHSARSSPATAITRPSGAPPVSHVVIIDLENHSFDNVLGKLCAQVASGEIAGRQPCDGVTTAVLSNGSAFDLYPAEDVVSPVGHSVFAQQTAVDGGQMDGFDQIVGCRKVSDYACLSQYDPSQIPNLAALAERYVVSDRTFEMSKSPSWVGHMVLASATQDGFQGDIPVPSTFTSQTGPGWGCDSYRDAEWWNGSAFVMVPSCVPDRVGRGPLPAVAGPVRPHDLRPAGRVRAVVEDLRGERPDGGEQLRLRLGDLPDVLRMPGVVPEEQLDPGAGRDRRRARRRAAELLDRGAPLRDLPAQQLLDDPGRQLDRRGRRARSNRARTGRAPPSSSRTTTAGASTTTCRRPRRRWGSGCRW